MKKAILKIIYKILGFYAKKVIAKNKPVVIAVTGSVGKTSTKEAIFKVLFDRFGSKVRANYGNLNAEIGIPLTILGYSKLPNKFLWPVFLIGAGLRIYAKTYPKYLILEMGIENPGDMKNFIEIAPPDYAVITSTAPAHIANFSSIEQFQQEKMSIISKLKEGGKAIVNHDDPKLSKKEGDNILSVSIQEGKADFYAENIKVSLSGTEYRIVTMGHKISVKSRLFGKQMIYSGLFAFAIADLIGLPLIKVGKSLEGIKPIPGRMNIIEGKKDTIIIDDTYNSNPASLAAALEMLSEIQYHHRKVAIIGNMNELGQEEKASHSEAGKLALGKCDLAIFVGANADIMTQGYGDRDTAFKFENRKQLEDKLDELIKQDDLILVKASQNGNYFEEIVKKLMKKPEEAETLLVRQSSFWKKRKK